MRRSSVLQWNASKHRFAGLLIGTLARGRTIGASNYSAERLSYALTLSRRRNLATNRDCADRQRDEPRPIEGTDRRVQEGLTLDEASMQLVNRASDWRK